MGYGVGTVTSPRTGLGVGGESMKLKNPDDFWKLLKKEFDRWWGDNTERKYSAFEDITQRTCLMIPLLVTFGKNNDYHVETEAYPHIDVGYYSNCTKSEWAKWSFEVAIEHENKPYPNWHEECSKLMAINAGLKVLISYYSETNECLNNEINEFLSIYESRKYHQKDDKYLFVFIPFDKFNETDKYSVYEFSDKGLQKIQIGR